MLARDKVCAVVVTFNRKALLLKAIKGIVAQSHRVDAIVIVDNASEDGTETALLEQGYISSVPARSDGSGIASHRVHLTGGGIEIKYARMETNIGGAGGFHIGQKLAYEDHCDWLWLMDDDGEPSADCLEILLETCRRTGMLALNPLVLDISDSKKLAFGMGKGIKTAAAALASADAAGVIAARASPFNGTLLHRHVCRECGFIKREMFIWGDEREYLLRLTARGIGYGTDTKALFFHPRTKTEKKSTLFGLVKVIGKPAHLEMNYYRNQGYINRVYGNSRFHKTLINGVLFYLIAGDLKKMITLARYYADGWSSRFSLANIRKSL